MLALAAGQQLPPGCSTNFNKANQLPGK